ncbi:hypothetical protein BHE74_00006415 [Ensete ventricosum]|nr:hypothetical protein BHE74_00006415 [Ensete ventricosum]RZS21474.1 hypothetical protein BHM03_00054127 [Ensete ventricosum]
MTLTKVPFRCNTTEERIQVDLHASPYPKGPQLLPRMTKDPTPAWSSRTDSDEAQDQGKKAHLIASESTTLLFPASRLAWSLNQTWIKRKKTRESHTECVIAVLSY